MNQKQIIIPKDCILCDSCNKTIAEGDFITTCEAEWCKDWLYCDECALKGREIAETFPFCDPPILDEGFTTFLIADLKHIEKGTDLSQTDLAKPIVMVFPE